MGRVIETASDGAIEPRRGPDYIGAVPRVITTENPGVEVRRYLRHWSNTDHLENEIQSRHPGTAAERRRRKARDVSATVSQGIELLEAASVASLLTKPLPLFYAAEAFAKAMAMINDASLEGGDFKAHGLRGVKKQRYFIRTLSCQVAAAGSDVWSRVATRLNADWTLFASYLDGVGTIADRRDVPGGAPPSTGRELALGNLLRHLPELAEDLPAAGCPHPFVVHVRDITVQQHTGPPPNASINVTLRHAHNPDTKEMIINHEAATGLLRGYNRVRDAYDVLVYSAGAPTLAEIVRPHLRGDIFGELYFDFARSRTPLAEFPTYYAALFTLSDVVRYQGQWKRLIDEHPEEAVLIERFLDIAVRKLPNLALNELAGGVYLFKVGGR
jgi:YaaC-like Protein